MKTATLNSGNSGVEKPLSARQRFILRFLWNFFQDNARWPTYREVAAALGTSSTNLVTIHLRSLARRGLVEPPLDGEGQGRGVRGARLRHVHLQADDTPGGRNLAATLGLRE